MLKDKIRNIVLYVCKKKNMNNFVVCDTSINDEPVKVKFTILSSNNREMSETKHSLKYENIQDRVEASPDMIDSMRMLNEALELDIQGLSHSMKFKDETIKHLQERNEALEGMFDTHIDFYHSKFIQMFLWNAVVTAAMVATIIYIAS
jgi:hypothetical protein